MGGRGSFVILFSASPEIYLNPHYSPSPPPTTTHPHFSSILQQQFQINNNELIKVLMGVVEVIAMHISHECAQCSARGFMCEMCDNQNPIYAFDILNVAACRGCNTFVHRRCIAASRACRRCKRLRDRKHQESAPKVASMQTAIGLLPGPGSALNGVGRGDATRNLMSQQTQRMAHVVEERRRRRSSREQPFGHFPRDFGDGALPVSGGGGSGSRGSSAMGGSASSNILKHQAQRQSRALALQAEKARASASASSGPSMLGASFSGEWGAAGEDDVFSGPGLDESVSTGGPGDFAGLGGGSGGGGSERWHWRTG